MVLNPPQDVLLLTGNISVCVYEAVKDTTC